MCLLIRVVKHMELCKARETVILPVWKSSCFWTVFCRDGVHWNSFVIDWLFLPKFPGLFIKGKARNSLFGSRPLNFDVIALRIDFRRPRSPCAYVGFCTKFSKDCDRCNQPGICIYRGRFSSGRKCDFVSVNPSVIALSPLYLAYGQFGIYSDLE